ncbi:MAG: hypothetical protein M3Z21_13795 [Pseudomonadota bacterium]|nr:hypothetical protein [Pseudomonadota bacterium]
MPMHYDKEDVFRRVYRPFNQHELEYKNAIKEKAAALLAVIEEAEYANAMSPAPEALDQARNRLREVVFWAVYAISGEQ